MMPSQSPGRPRYPIVRCLSGHKDEPGYAVCRHVADEGAPPVKVDLATSLTMGVIKCGRPHSAGDFLACCACCARYKGWLVVK